jgi:adenosine deaminase
MPPEFYDQFLTELARNPKWQKYLVGFDYSGTPYQRFITDYTSQIQKGKDLGLGLTVHTAEIPDQFAETAPIFALGPTRVGHFNYFTEKELDH